MQIDKDAIKNARDAALRAMNAIRFYKIGKPIAPVWPKCPGCGKICTADTLYSVSQTGLCKQCAG